MSTCDRFERERLESLEWRNFPDAHEEQCEDCRRQRDAYNRLADSFSDLSAPRPPSGWEERVIRVCLNTSPAELAARLDDLGLKYWLNDQTRDAIAMYQRALDIKVELQAKGIVDYRSFARTFHQIGECYWSLDDWESARASFQKSVEMGKMARNAAFGGSLTLDDINGQTIGESVHRLADCLLKLGHTAEACRHYASAASEKGNGDATGHVNAESIRESLDRYRECLEARAAELEARKKPA